MSSAAEGTRRIGPGRSDLSYAVELVELVCVLAGSPEYLDGIRDELKGFRGRATTDPMAAIAAAYDWFVRAMSYQGISDEVARNYMADHGVPTWPQIASTLKTKPECERLVSFWHFTDCQYRKAGQICAAPQHLPDCPLPRQPLRNGNLNQLAYSLYLFVRDVADNDLIGWIDAQFAAADEASAPDRIEHMRDDGPPTGKI